MQWPQEFQKHIRLNAVASKVSKIKKILKTTIFIFPYSFFSILISPQFEQPFTIFAAFHIDSWDILNLTILAS